MAPGSTACHKATKWSQEAGEKETCKEILMKSGISQCDKDHRLISYLLVVVSNSDIPWGLLLATTLHSLDHPELSA